MTGAAAALFLAARGFAFDLGLKKIEVCFFAPLTFPPGGPGGALIFAVV
jgi:hypothetical protein